MTLADPATQEQGSTHTESYWLDKAANYIIRTRLDKSNVSGPVLVSGEGSIVCDVNGKEYLDFNSGQMCSALGHRAPRVVAAIKESCDTLIHASSSFFNTHELELAEKLASILPPQLKRSLFLESGADANEAAVQIAKFYTGRNAIASPHTSFHGLSDSTRALTFGVRDWHRGYGSYAPGSHAFMAPYCHNCPIGLKYPDCKIACLTGSFQVLDAEIDSPLAAVITEPLFSAGGVIEPPHGWLAEVKHFCEQRGALLILDEAQTGLGKLGSMWAFEQEGVIPDILTVSKHFGGGLSISAVVTTDAIADAVQAENFVHGHSHTSDPLPCAAASATIDMVVDEDLPRRAREIGKQWRRHLDELAAEHTVIGDIRGRGLLQGLELISDTSSNESGNRLGYDLERYCVAEGLLFSVRLSGSVLRFVPPWTTTEEEMDRAAQILDRAFVALGY